MKPYVVLFFVFISFVGYAQSGETSYSKEKEKLDFVFSPGIFIQKEFFAEANILIGKVVYLQKEKLPIIGVSGIRIGLESNFKGGNDYIIAPKIGFEMSATAFCLRLSALNYFQNNQSEFRVLPELGISIGGLVNLTYGYGISFNNTINGISNHRLSLTFNLNRKLNNTLAPYKSIH